MDKHDTLLLSCGTAENRAHLRSVLGERYHVLEAGNVEQTLLLLQQNMDCTAALVLDLSGLNSWQMELLKEPTYSDAFSLLPVIVISQEEDAELVHAAFRYGAADVIPLDYEPYAMLRRIKTIVELNLHKNFLEAMVQEQADALWHTNDRMVDALSSIIEYRSLESGQHILRIRHFTRILLEEVARSCPEYGLEDRQIAIISNAAALHDIGKIAIPDSILLKPGPLTPQEREVMQTHSETGCRILDSISGAADEEYLRYAHNICRYHHERWDGAGYPEGLTGEQIPICAQVVGLADAYDALTTKRVYKDAYPFALAVNKILRGECGVFSPKLLECFKHVTNAFEKLARDYADGLSPRSEPFDTTLPAPKPQEENSLERVRAKYFTLVHYINGLLIEGDLNQDLMHLIYNPYPEMSWLQDVERFTDMVELLQERIVPQEEETICVSLKDSIQSFMEQDLRRVTHRVRIRTGRTSEGERFEVTLLRLNPIQASRKTMAVLCRRMEGEEKQLWQDTMPEGLQIKTFICRNDEDFTLVRLDNGNSLLAGYSQEALDTRFGGKLMELVVPEDRQRLRQEFRKQLHRGTEAQAAFRVRRGDGTLLWVLDRSSLIMGNDGQEYLHSMLVDITALRREYEDQQEKLRRYEIILAQTENVLFELDVKEDRISFSDTWETIFGMPEISGSFREALGKGAYFHPDDLSMLQESMERLEGGSDYEMTQVRMVTRLGRYIWCRIRASAIREGDGTLAKIVGILINIDAEKRAEQLLEDRAQRDALTKLLNKTAARKQAEEYLGQLPGKIKCALLIIDLDNFKQVNDRYGHLFGDTVLTRAAWEIRKLFREQDIVARIGGDEFLVLMRGSCSRTLLESRCQQLVQTISGLLGNREGQVPLSCSVGVALAPEHGSAYYELFKGADRALYQAKGRGKNGYVFYDPGEEGLPVLSTSTTAANTRIDSDEEPGMAEDNIVRHAFQRLYTTQNVEEAVNEILALIGRKMNVSRVYVFENSDDNRYCSNTYEWCNEGIPPEIDKLQKISYETDIPGYQENFDEHGIFYCPDVKILPQETYEIVEAQGIQSMLQCAIREGGVFRGYIGFDECVEQRLWTKEQIQVLSYFSEMLSVFLLKWREREKALEMAREMISLLDNQNAFIYIVDPESCELKYLNSKAKQMAPGAAPGMCCYQALMDQKERCPWCPAQGIREKKNSNTLLCSVPMGSKLLMDATQIRWNREDTCLVTCRELPAQA